jgi:hydrogenase maturation protein HypF
MLQVSHTVILTDAHPGYHVGTKGWELAKASGISCIAYQHHRAHFAALLAEHRLLQTGTPVLGFIWDGTGYGDDGQIWGGETFLFKNGAMDRVAQLTDFPQLLGDKMSREPRLSALSLLREFPQGMDRIGKHFSDKEWSLYRQPAFWKNATLQTSSMGRLLDGISTLLTGCAMSRYEGEAAMLLEAMARTCEWPTAELYDLPLIEGRISWPVMMKGILNDLAEGEEKNLIAHKVFRSLAHAILHVASAFRTRRLAFSGGVFQNALLVDLITEESAGRYELLFHRQLGPNDENIALGQLALYQLDRTLKITGGRALQHDDRPLFSETLKH